MKTRKHGKGMNHQQVVRFSNRLASCAQNRSNCELTDFEIGWIKACQYFAHQLREQLREIESAH